MLDLTVKVINIRSEENHELLEKCQILKEYSQFVETVAKFAFDGKEDSYKRAIEECIQKGILADYLKRKGSEVVNMLTAEYDYDMDIEVQREEAFENGVKQTTHRISELMACLTKDNRLEELAKSAKDPAFLEQLMKEYNL